MKLFTCDSLKTNYEIEHDPKRNTEGCLLSMGRFLVAFENQIINT
ncbi:hypothetical protein Aconfl_28690 [Algoriphagus confluentis]|uniref:Uncharacterized protein n=1 Tax=Algoriphagus confluentis TaxID=1697556 RepID=A0ABQ6PRE4_9BACT|nr:hypothetical protein Aconfl_28690 [Algoriphagus confluentis]